MDSIRPAAGTRHHLIERPLVRDQMAGGSISHGQVRRHQVAAQMLLAISGHWLSGNASMVWVTPPSCSRMASMAWAQAWVSGEIP